jgi:YlmC/YmxH family sporulation protein
MRFLTLQCKDVVDAQTGTKLGFVSDIEIDPLCHCIQAIIIEKSTPLKWICIFKGPPHFVIPIERIITIGEDVILVDVDNC